MEDVTFLEQIVRKSNVSSKKKKNKINYVCETLVKGVSCDICHNSCMIWIDVNKGVQGYVY
jgi:hypothetical protein